MVNFITWAGDSKPCSEALVPAGACSPPGKALLGLISLVDSAHAVGGVSMQDQHMGRETEMTTALLTQVFTYQWLQFLEDGGTIFSC